MAMGMGKLPKARFPSTKGRPSKTLLPLGKGTPLDNGKLLVRLVDVALTPRVQFHLKRNLVLDIIIVTTGVLFEGKKPLIRLTTRLGPIPN